MEHDLYVTGIGGQGIQLVCKTLGLAATHEGRQVMISSEYGGAMRGGSSRATVVIGDGPLNALPVIPNAGAAIALHTLEWTYVARRLRPGALIVCEARLTGELADTSGHRLVPVDANALAKQAGSTMAAGMVLLGAYNALTRLVAPESLVEAMKQQIPAYRAQHVATNAKALALGHEAGLALLEAVR